MKLPKVEIKKINRKTVYFVDGKEVKPYFSNGCRKRIRYGKFIIKFNHKFAKHYDLELYKQISRWDKRYFPKCYFDNGVYSIHEYVPHVRLESVDQFTADTYYKKAGDLRYKYKFGDFSLYQLGIRKSNKMLVYFDYGY
jgi:hypothetical protein